jgi:peptidyl-prolyl cis-trans isomerase D
MMSFLRKHMRLIFLITIVGFLGGAFIGFGGYFFGSAANADIVADVNGTKIPYRRYQALYNRVLDNLQRNKTEINDSTIARTKQEVLQDLIQEEVFWKEAKKYGISVSDQELAGSIQNYPAFQKDGRFDRQAYFQILYQVLHTTPPEFEESQRRQIAISKLRNLIASNVQVSEPEIRMEYMRTHGGKLTDFDKERDKFTQNLRQQKVMLVFNEWFKQLNQTMKVKVFLSDKEPRAA